MINRNYFLFLIETRKEKANSMVVENGVKFYISLNFYSIDEKGNKVISYPRVFNFTNGNDYKLPLRLYEAVVTKRNIRDIILLLNQTIIEYQRNISHVFVLRMQEGLI